VFCDFLACTGLVCLNQITERQRLNGGELGVTRRFQKVSFLWQLGCSLQVDLDTSLGGFGLGLFVVDLALKDFLLALGVTDMFNSDMNTLFDDASIDQLVDTDSDGGLGDIEDNSGASVVSLVGHTLVDGRIGENVYVVTDLDVHHVLGQVNGALLPEFLGKHVARARSDSE